jgi:hypothetical protein
MATKQNQKLARLTKTVLDIVFWLLIGAIAFLILWIALSPLILRVSDIAITSSVPVAIGSGDDPQFEVEIANAEANGIRNAYVEEAQGTLRLETTDWYSIFISNLGKLVIATGLAYVVYQLRTILQALLQGEVFTQENVARMHRIGYSVLVVGFINAAAEYFAALEVLRQLIIVEPALSLPSPFQAVIILASLLILILAQVWSYGLELEREKALTI